MKRPVAFIAVATTALPGIRTTTGLARVVLVAVALLASAGVAFGAEHAGAPQAPMNLTLADAISLALERSRDVANARLSRIVQKQSLRVAEDKFAPDATIGPFVRYDVPDDREEHASAGISSQVSVLVPTGGRVALFWDNAVDESANKQWTTRLGANFTQPLLRGAGVPVNTASLKTARITERRNVLGLKSTVMQTIASVIAAYRSLIQAERRLEISARSLERARELLEVNRLLIRSGRMAERDIIQTEATVASRELDRLQARNNLDSARLTLIDHLDIDAGARIRPTETIAVDPAVPDVEQSLEKAFRNRPDWLRGLLQVESAEINLLLAKDNRRWNLSASVGASFNSANDTFQPFETGDADYHATLNLNVPFGDLSRQQQYVSASIALQQARNGLAELRQAIDLEVRSAVRNVEVLSGQVDLARRRRELAEQKFAIEKDKLNRGLSTNFRVSTFEDDLVSAQNSEVDTSIAYLNALSSLDRTLGTVLETWGVDITRTDEEWTENR